MFEGVAWVAVYAVMAVMWMTVIVVGAQRLEGVAHA
mgnify:FL=1|jgi:hypothetical protein